jgi:hypothetical protein
MGRESQTTMGKSSYPVRIDARRHAIGWAHRNRPLRHCKKITDVLPIGYRWQGRTKYSKESYKGNVHRVKV